MRAYPSWHDIDDEHYADVESFDEHYADEINGSAIAPVDDVPTPATATLANAPGQLQLALGAAYR